MIGMRRRTIPCLCAGTLIILAFMAMSCALSWREHPPLDTETENEQECSEGLISCDGVCVDIASDHAHCGGCNHECHASEVCSGGTCSTECPSGETVCNGGCFDTGNDINHCGDCAVVCTAGEHADPVCTSGVCDVICHDGWEDRDGDGSCETATTEEEVCNGLDDNGDTVCDNGVGMVCCSGAAGTCTTACGSQGTRTCLSTCVWGSCQAPAETCNGVDDNCDGRIDEGCADPCTGHCSNGTQDCGETGVDCGGECSACVDPCTGHCSNGTQDCGETGVDCGGECSACVDPCTGHCSNGTQDCGETGVDCGGECSACSSCSVPGHMGNHEHGEPCSTPGTWRCVYETVYCGNYVPQVCISGIWQNFRCSAYDCPNCCGSYSINCCHVYEDPCP
jgi:hypothetical protein